ncbi:MAG: hypothetical protein G01um101438_831 [Parcubacteria group bacterium Gr01-1014_38]|nr:MAG: hypothetical protein G01um101438_831 [Parcubacteria group bacterium Gr01-1014_38]
MRRLLLHVVLLVAVLTAIALGLGYLYQTNRTAFWVWVATLAIFTAYIPITSLYFIEADEMIAFYLFGTYWNTYVNGTYYELHRTYCESTGKGKTGVFGLDVVILLWPFWLPLRLPTSTVHILVRIGRVFTKNVPGAPRVRLRADTTILFRLAPDVRRFVQTFRLGRAGQNLAEEVEMPDATGKTHRESRVALGIQEEVQETVLEAVRTAASRFTWGGGEDEIVHDKTALEDDVLRVLSEGESIFVQSGMLQRIEKGWHTLGRRALEGDPNLRPQPGPTLLNIDFNIEEIAPEPIPEKASPLEEAIDKPMIALLEANADEHRGDGEGRRLRKIADRTDTDGSEVFAGHMLREAKTNVRLVVVGEALMNVVRGIFRTRGGPRRRRGGRGTRGGGTTT